MLYFSLKDTMSISTVSKELSDSVPCRHCGLVFKQSECPGFDLHSTYDCECNECEDCFYNPDLNHFSNEVSSTTVLLSDLFETESLFPLTKLPRTCGDCMTCENCEAELKAIVECTKSLSIEGNDLDKMLQWYKKENVENKNDLNLELEDWYDEDLS